MIRALLSLALLGCVGCKPKPCVSPMQGRILPARPVDRMPKLPQDTPLEKAVEAAALDRAEWKTYAEQLEELLIALGAIKTDPKEADHGPTR